MPRNVRRPGLRTSGSARTGRAPAIEGLESRRLPAAALPDIALLSATTHDSRSVTVVYNINGNNINKNFDIQIDRSGDGQVDATALPLSTFTVVAPGTGQGPLTLDDNGRPAADEGSHTLTIPIAGGLPPNPQHPFVVAEADPQNVLAESSKANNTADFRTYVIGVVTHGGIQPKSWVNGPPWEQKMAASLRAEGYDAVIAFNWVYDSNHPGSASRQGPRLAKFILGTANRFPASAPVDLDFIGHSEGAIVNSEALVRLDQELPANLASGYVQMTMLDPHAANTNPQQQYSVEGGPLGWLAKMEIDSYQSRARDPLPFVPANVDSADVFYQHTPVAETHSSNSGIYNLWGQVPVSGSASYFNLTGPGISHAGTFGVYKWYQDNIVPTLGDGNSFIQSQILTAARVNPGQETNPPTYAGTAAPGATVTLLLTPNGAKDPALVARTVASADGSWSITVAQPLAPGRYQVVAQASKPVDPTGRTIHMTPIVWLPALEITRSIST
jgi:hypothetical protein